MEKHKRIDLDKPDTKVLVKTQRVIIDEKKPTVPRAGKSTPAEATVRKKARTGVDHFADIAAREEETTQKALELKKKKFKGETEKALAKVRAQAEIQMNKDRLRMEYAQKKLEFEFKLQLQAAQRPQMGGQGLSRSAASAANIYYPAAPSQAQTSFHEYSPFSGHHQDSAASRFYFQASDYNSYTSQAQAASNSSWQPNMASSSAGTQRSLLSLASQSASPYSGWEQTPTDDTSKSESLSFTEQLNKNDSDMYQ